MKRKRSEAPPAFAEGSGEAVARAALATPEGVVQVLFSEVGVCGLLMPGRRLDAKQRRSLPERDLPAAMAPLGRLIEGYFAGRAVDPAGAAVPLDFGPLTPFARRVYEELRAVPRGEVVTYAELARRAGSPGAARAVGSLMSRNRVPLVVPCHRVIGAGGSLGGFTAPGGLETKRALLEREGALVPGGGERSKRGGDKGLRRTTSAGRRRREG